MTLAWVLAALAVLFLVFDPLGIRQRRRRLRLVAPGGLSYGFFHPDAFAGGGGERVLWQAVAAIQTQWPDCSVSVYVREHSLDSAAIAAKVKTQFNIDIVTSKLSFIGLRFAKWIEARRYPRLTLLAQSIGSLVPGLEGLLRDRPDVFLDTVGFAFLNPVARACGCLVVSYVHYPTISSDMLSKVDRGISDFNNSTAITSSPFLTRAKLMYYKAFAALYGFVGSYADVVMVNSTWTRNHIDSIWRVPDRTTIVYPPCDTESLLGIPLDHRRLDTILSIAQFRRVTPEKAHRVQLEAFADLLANHPEYRKGGKRPLRLLVAGGCRNEEDLLLLKDLEAIAGGYGPDHDIVFRPNVPYAELREMLSSSKIGLHTMTDEHFGISIIEYMAAGLLTLAHDSGGPKTDIVVPFQGNRTGFLASSVDAYSESLHQILQLSDAEAGAIRRNARAHVLNSFSAAAFGSQFTACITRKLRPG
ncbi:asparagine-linked glycosylation protein 11 [Hyaloraphidium curvatum]|nr:asparagine-linked glycosylation protein 11 [Hyaloraphidium curvatum]